MNAPVSCAASLLLPAQVEIDKLVQHHIDPNIQLLYSEKLDKLYGDHNMVVIVSLLNFVSTKLVCKHPLLYILYMLMCVHKREESV